MGKSKKNMPNDQKLTKMVALKLTPMDYKLFMAAVKMEGLNYATELLRKIVLEYLGRGK